ncbi:hypothetical protein Leryth_022112 [Lithospermum erythrorhizon]|nr:hypothetical protein Leryth_022112 [Lithospermum erythrorhizon]
MPLGVRESTDTVPRGSTHTSSVSTSESTGTRRRSLSIESSDSSDSDGDDTVDSDTSPPSCTPMMLEYGQMTDPSPFPVPVGRAAMIWNNVADVAGIVKAKAKVASRNRLSSPGRPDDRCYLHVLGSKGIHDRMLEEERKTGKTPSPLGILLDLNQPCTADKR